MRKRVDQLEVLHQKRPNWRLVCVPLRVDGDSLRRESICNRTAAGSSVDWWIHFGKEESDDYLATNYWGWFYNRISPQTAIACDYIIPPKTISKMQDGMEKLKNENKDGGPAIT